MVLLQRSPLVHFLGMSLRGCGLALIDGRPWAVLTALPRRDNARGPLP
jgi:hypothetical protein